MTTFNVARRAVLVAGLATPFSLLADSGDGGRQVRMAPAMRCAEFLDTLGVNTHLRYAQSQYNAVEAVLSALNYCGIHHVRDTAVSGAAPNAGHYGRLADGGARFCLFWGTGRPMADAVAQVSALVAAHPGSVEFLEGPNEIQPGFAYGGQAGLAAGQKFMADMKTAASADPHLAKVQLVSFTSFAPVSSIADYANQHPYPKAGVQPGDLIRMRHAQWVGPGGAMPGKPMVFTEFGYHTLVGRPARPGHWQGVDEDCQAILLLNGLFDAAATGVSRTYLYQLFDANRDAPGHVTQENHFGLFRADGQPKPAATAIKSLVALIADRSPSARSFPLNPGAIVVKSDVPVNAMPLHASNGQIWMVLWQEAPIWDQSSMTRAQIPAAVVTLSLPKAGEVTTFNPTDATTSGAAQRGTTMRMQLGAEPMLLRVNQS